MAEPITKPPRATEEGLGGTAGMMFGFFLGCGLFTAWSSSHKDMPRLVTDLGMLLLGAGGGALGGLAGAFLGRRFLPIAADDAQSPSLRRPPPSVAWPVLGMFLGMLAGLRLGMAGVTLMAGDSKLAWLSPILFFGGGGGGAGLGLLLGGLFANRRGRPGRSPEGRGGV
jgi:hypothetical protein